MSLSSSLRLLAKRQALFNFLKIGGPTNARNLCATPVLDRERGFIFGKKGSSPVTLRGRTIDESDAVTTNIDALAEKTEELEKAAEENEDSGENREDNFQFIPDQLVLDKEYNGVKYKDLPWVLVLCTKNNTRMMCHDKDNNRLEYATPMMYGFINAKKRTNVAAQIVGLSIGQVMRNRNIRTVKVGIDGFNNGRVASLKGLVQAGIKIVSVSDLTPVDWHTKMRPKKRKRQN